MYYFPVLIIGILLGFILKMNGMDLLFALVERKTVNLKDLGELTINLRLIINIFILKLTICMLY